MHGANRLASNSLLECVVFSARAAKQAQKFRNNNRKIPINYNLKKYKLTDFDFHNNCQSPRFIGTDNSLTEINVRAHKIIKLGRNEEKNIASIQSKIKQIMWDYAGIIRTRKGLLEALVKIEKLGEKFNNNFKNKTNRKIIETKNMIAASRLIVKASLGRRKSAGAFYIEK